MAGNLLELTIASVVAPLFRGQVRSVTLPGAEGEMTVMANHESLVTTLRKGVIVVRDAEGERHEFSIEHGALEIAENHATVLL